MQISNCMGTHSRSTHYPSMPLQPDRLTPTTWLTRHSSFSKQDFMIPSIEAIASFLQMTGASSLRPNSLISVPPMAVKSSTATCMSSRHCSNTDVSRTRRWFVNASRNSVTFFQREWSGRRTLPALTSMYGHDLENIHILITARDALGEDNRKFLKFYRGVFENAQKFGEDRLNGG